MFPNSQRHSRLALSFRAALCALLAVALGAGCQSLPGRKDGALKEQLRSFTQSLNEKSREKLFALLSDQIEVDGMPDALSRASLLTGVQWPPGKILDHQVLGVRDANGLLEARVAFYMIEGYFMLRLGFDNKMRLARIDGEAPWKETVAKVGKPFTAPAKKSGALLFVKGKVDGRSGYLLFDTGSSHLLLNTKYFTPAPGEARPGMSATVRGIQSSQHSSTEVDLEWGGLRHKSAEAHYHDLSGMEKPGISPLLGAIGYDQLKNFAVSIDWPRSRISVAREFAAPSGSLTIPFGEFLHTPLLSMKVGAVTVPMIFDSGSEMNMLPNLDGIAADFQETGRLKGLSDGGAAAAVDSRVGTLRQVRLGGLHLEGMPFVVHPIPYLHGKGILGNPLLQAGTITIDYRNRRLIVEPVTR